MYSSSVGTNGRPHAGQVIFSSGSGGPSRTIGTLQWGQSRRITAACPSVPAGACGASHYVPAGGSAPTLRWAPWEVLA